MFVAPVASGPVPKADDLPRGTPDHAILASDIDQPTGAGGNLEVFNALLAAKSSTRRALPKLEIVPHPLAPLFSRPETASAVLEDVIRRISSGERVNEGLREVLRQAGFVSLWFFLKFIAGYANPFDQLNEDLHLDMCNYRQKLLKPGCRGAMFIPRGHFKSTVVTEGGAAWEILRNPDIRIRITNAIASKAEDFMHSVKAVFDSNALVAYLYPEFVPRKNAPRWNDTEIVVPNRTKHFREATVEAGGVGGASEGHHYDLHIVDDIIGLGDLNAGSQSSASMSSARKWFWASEQPLLVSVKTSRVIVVGTRYAVDDVYDDIVKETCQMTGAEMANFKPNPDGRWHVYYRKGIEGGEVIFPENFTIEVYREMAQKNWWTFVTQYLNDPYLAGLAEFSDYSLPKCWVDFDRGWGKWFVLWQEGDIDDLKREPLESFDVIIAVDPAATERYVSAKTSRSVVLVLATRFDGKRFLIDLRADYVEPTKMFEWIFAFAQKYSGILRGTFLEANAGFKVLGPILRKEEREKGIWLNLKAAPAYGDKVARIRSTLQPELHGTRLYVVEDYIPAVLEEARAFPQSTKKDILDALANGVANSIVPDNPARLEERMADEARTYIGRNKTTGY